MKDKDILMDALANEKSMSINMTCALNEASNTNYYNELFNMFTEINEAAKDLYKIGYNEGLYNLTFVNCTDINKTITKLKNEEQN